MSPRAFPMDHVGHREDILNSQLNQLIILFYIGDLPVMLQKKSKDCTGKLFCCEASLKSKPSATH